VARIAFLIPNLAGGGAERVALTLVGALADRGHEVDLLVMEPAGELAGQVPAGVKLVDLHVKRTRKVLWPLIRYLRKRRPDALQVSMWPLTTVGILATRLARSGTRCVVSDHAVLSDHYARSKHALLGASVRLFYPLANARVGVSTGAVEDLARLARLDPSMFTVIANPISFPRKLQRRADVEALWPYAAPFQAGQPLTVTSTCNATSTWLAAATNAPPPPPPASAQKGERGR
jgi:hypothetical protein